MPWHREKERGPKDGASRPAGGRGRPSRRRLPAPCRELRRSLCAPPPAATGAGTSSPVSREQTCVEVCVARDRELRLSDRV